MADDIDSAVEKYEIVFDADVQEIRRRAALIPAGEAGECKFCGEEFSRIVNGVCCRCRDRRHLP